jgi:hypothetical protein
MFHITIKKHPKICDTVYKSTNIAQHWIWQVNFLDILTNRYSLFYFNDLPYIYYSKHILIVITISILMSQINAAKSLHNKNIVKTITTYTSRLTISHLTFHTSDLKVRRDTIRFEIINTYISLHRLNLRIIIIVPINVMLEFSIKYHY